MIKGIYKKILICIFHSHGLTSNKRSIMKILVTFSQLLITSLLLDVTTPKKPVI